MVEKNKDLEKATNYDAVIEKSLAELQTASSTLKTLASSYSKKRDYEAALKYAFIRVELFPNSPEAIFDLGMVHYNAHQEDEAEPFFLKAIEANPRLHVPHMMLSLIYNHRRLFDKAIQSLEAARNLMKSEDKQIDFLLAFNRLAMEDYVLGFDLFRARYDERNTGKCVSLVTNTNVLRKETDLSNKTVLISQEQGFGDVINFIRFAPFIKQKGPKALYIKVQKPLWRLMQYNYGDICELPKSGDQIEINYHLPIMDLPYILETQSNSVPLKAGYLSVAPEDSAASLQKLFLNNGKKHIAIVWRGSPDHGHNHTRSMTLEQFLNYLPPEAREANLYSLQFQPTEQEKFLLAMHGVTNLGDSFEDFYDTACALHNLDALISVDTSVVHVSGAMNVKTFVLLSYACDWRWSTAELTHENNWYRSVSCCRQPIAGDWESAFKQISLTTDCDTESISDLKETI